MLLVKVHTMVFSNEVLYKDFNLNHLYPQDQKDAFLYTAFL